MDKLKFHQQFSKGFVIILLFMYWLTVMNCIGVVYAVLYVHTVDYAYFIFDMQATSNSIL